MVHTLPTRGTPLHEKVEKLSQTAIRHDSNTHMKTFEDHSEIFYPEFSFHMKHMVYISSTMHSYMVSLKYDFEEFRSKHWLYTDTFADISNEISVMPKLQSELQVYMSKMPVRVKWIIRESKNQYTDFPHSKSIMNDLITPKDTFLHLDTIYYNNTLNIYGYVKIFKTTSGFIILYIF